MIMLKLTGPRGDNPLGFLCALGIIATLEDAGVEAALSWSVLTPFIRFNLPPDTRAEVEAACDGRECPVGHNPPGMEGAALLRILANQLRRDEPSESAREKAAHVKREIQKLQTSIKDLTKKIKERYPGRSGLREREAAMKRDVEPLTVRLAEARANYQQALRFSSNDPTVTLGRNLAARNDEFQSFLSFLIEEFSRDRIRRTLDLAAAYGVSNPNDGKNNIQPTPWALMTGAGHQHFLDTVRELMIRCTACHLARAIWGPWLPKDEGLSLRLDPSDDRRYALMASDPTAPGNTSLTLWGANRLAFEALRFFPAYPTARSGIGVVAWRPSDNGGYRSDAQIRWPLWTPALTACEIRSLLALPDIWIDSPSARLALRRRGVHAVFASRRIQVDKYYFNLLPGAPVWALAQV